MARVDLPRRQLQVVRLIGGERLSYKAAARELGVSVYTVRTHAERVRERLELGDVRLRDALTLAFRELERGG